MKKLREIVEATKSLHPMALHVKPVMVNGQQKYKVHAVGKGLADGINHGEHLSDSELDDAQEMGAKIKHVKESVNEGKMAELDHDLENMKDKDFETHYGKPKSNYKKSKKDEPEDESSDVKEAMSPQEEMDFGPEADKNITVQLKKAMDMMEHGEKTGSDVEFADGQKYFVEGVVAHKVLVAMEQMKPEVRAQAQNAVYQSFAHLMAAHQMLSK